MADKTDGSQAAKNAAPLNKKEAVRRALRTLGNEAKPLQIREHVKKRYHIEMGLDHISTVKGEILREGGQPRPAAPKSSSATLAAPKPASSPLAPRVAPTKGTTVKAPSSPAEGAAGISLKDIETVKDLVERVGAPSLRKLIDVMAR